MSQPTDTELRRRWEASNDKLTRLTSRSDPQSIPRRAELLREQHLIKVEWNQLLSQKRRGVLTDRGGVDLAIKTAKALSLVHGITLNFVEAEGQKDEQERARFWWLSARQSESRPAVDERNFHQFASAATDEMLSHNILFQDPLSKKSFVIGRVHATGLPCAIWMVKTWVWTGPQ